MRSALALSTAGLLVLALLAVAHVRSRRLETEVRAAAPLQAALPARVLWVWERPEDLRALDPGTAGVAVLEQTLRLGASVRALPRRQPLLLPSGIARIAVVRLESEPGFPSHLHDSALLEQTVADLQHVAEQPGIAALQLDFDARKSERAFYRRLLEQLRPRLPAGLPLDITALVSWCSTDDWIADLPINAATPMFFRMEPDRRRLLLAANPAYQLHEPLCSGSVGVSTTEPWPPAAAHKRIFLFPDHGWANDLAALHLPSSNLSQPPADQP